MSTPHNNFAFTFATVTQRQSISLLLMMLTEKFHSLSSPIYASLHRCVFRFTNKNEKAETQLCHCCSTTHSPQQCCSFFLLLKQCFRQWKFLTKFRRRDTCDTRTTFYLNLYCIRHLKLKSFLNRFQLPSTIIE